MTLEKLRGRLGRTTSGDAGIGIVSVIMVAAVITAMTVTAVSLTVTNLKNVRSDRQSLNALATSEAGVAQAISYLRSSNVASLTCVEPAPGAAPGPSCTGPGPSWISATNPMQVRVDGGTGACVASSDCFRVWIARVGPYVPPNCAERRATPPGRCFNTFRIHSTGVSGDGPGARRVAVDVKLAPYSYPLGIFSETNFSGNGNVGVHSQSIFTGGCIINRQDDSSSGSGFQFQWDAGAGRPVLDVFYGVPAAAHAVGAVSTQNNGSCPTSGGSPAIHSSTARCNATFRFDQSGHGGPLTAGDGCYGAFTTAEGAPYPTTSGFSAQDLERIGYRPRGLTDAQYESLRTQAQSYGLYNVAPSSIHATLTALSAAGVNSPVLYWDNGDVDLHQSDFPASFSRAVSNTVGCTQQSVTIVVAGNGNDLSYQGGNTAPFLVAAIFVPDGELTGNGGRNTIGTVFAKTIDLGGNVDFYLDDCYANSPPGGTLDVQAVNWAEDDSTDAN